MSSPRLTAAALAALVSLAGCTRSAEAPASPFKPSSSIQDIMVAIVDPSADALWESVSSETTKAGIEEKQPRTDAEWLAVRSHAIALLEAGNLLIIEGRDVTHGAKKTEDAHVPGILPPQDIARAIAADRPAFAARARELQDAAGQALSAIKARDPARLMAAGGAIDQACERCHLAYWYPNSTRPTAKWPAPLKAAGHR
jgi:hypothetical protein